MKYTTMKSLKKIKESKVKLMTVVSLIFVATIIAIGQKATSVSNVNIQMKQILNDPDLSNDKLIGSSEIDKRDKVKANKTTFLKIEEFVLNENFLSEAKEEEVEVENWMLDETHFLKSDENLSDVVAEEEIEIESWMLDKDHFDAAAGTESDEAKNKIEDWMLDPCQWAADVN